MTQNNENRTILDPSLAKGGGAVVGSDAIRKRASCAAGCLIVLCSLLSVMYTLVFDEDNKSTWWSGAGVVAVWFLPVPAACFFRGLFARHKRLDWLPAWLCSTVVFYVLQCLSSYMAHSSCRGHENCHLEIIEDIKMLFPICLVINGIVVLCDSMSLWSLGQWKSRITGIWQFHFLLRMLFTSTSTIFVLWLIFGVVLKR